MKLWGWEEKSKEEERRKLRGKWVGEIRAEIDKTEKKQIQTKERLTKNYDQTTMKRTIIFEYTYIFPLLLLFT